MRSGKPIIPPERHCDSMPLYSRAEYKGYILGIPRTLQPDHPVVLVAEFPGEAAMLVQR